MKTNKIQVWERHMDEEGKTAYERLTDFLARLENRKNQLLSREGEILRSLAAKEEAYPEAAIQGRARMAPVSR